MGKRLAVALICLPWLVSCVNSSHSVAPVVDLVESHVVNRGETLYEIAWCYGKDYRDLAAINHIREPYVIYPGQVLVIKKGAGAPHHVSPEKLPQPVRLSSSLRWEWPVEGKIVKSFKLTGNDINKGIDIAGKAGASVRAASAGKVVYAGSGLRGYGQLIILKHDADYLSAYAHNDRLLVREGESVKQGQTIAQMGKTNADQATLHFEIRKEGEPVDPLLFIGKAR